MTASESTTSRIAGRLLLVLGILFVVAGIATIGASFLSLETAQGWTAGIRNPDDLTPDRHLRFQLLCWFFGIVGVVWGVAAIGWNASILAYSTRAASEWKSRERVHFSPPGLVLIVIGFGVAVRLWFLNLPMAYDESYTFVNFASKSLLLGLGDYNSTNNHLLNTLLMHWSYRLFGQQDWALRVPVLCVGVALLPLVWFWSRERFGSTIALLALAMTAVSPAIVSYSVNARGYLFVMTSAVALDLSLLRVTRQSTCQSLWWIVTTIAIVVGCWSMPLMVYPLVGMIGWFVLESVSRRNEIDLRERLRSLAIVLVIGVPLILLLYAPSFVFRGLLFLRDPIVRDVSLVEWFGLFGTVWKGALQIWFAFQGLTLVFGLLVGVGIYALWKDRPNRWSLMIPFLAAGLLMFLQQVTPPPRILLYLAPWATAIAMLGLVEVHPRGVNRENVFRVWEVLLVVGGMAYLLFRPFLYDEIERRDYASVPALVSALQNEIKDSPERAHRLIAPLPCDLPAIYYLRQAGFDIPVNGLPEQRETLWLITRTDQRVEEVLSSPLVGLGNRIESLGAWRKVDSFPTLDLYRREGD